MLSAVIALVVSALVITGMLMRLRSHARPDDYEANPLPRKRPTRQERILQKLEPLPEIPTVMDLVREEVAETGVESIPGHDGLSGPVMLKVFRRDQLIRQRCIHDAFEFVIRDGVDPTEATEDDVALYCGQCGPIEPTPDIEPDVDLKSDRDLGADRESGTESGTESA